VNYVISLVIGIVIFLVARLNKKWAGIVSLIGLIPFYVLAATGLIAITESVEHSAVTMILPTLGTYLVGLLFGWVPSLLFTKPSSY